MKVQQFVLPNDDREVRFVGEELGSATSRVGRDEDAIRWTEVVVFKTRAGQYVLQRVGASSVYHGGPRECGGSRGERVRTATLPKRLGSEKTEDLVACPVCQPGPWHLLDQVIVERDVSTVTVAEDADALVTAAHSRDRDDPHVLFLSKTAERALRAAAERDPEVREAFLVQEVA